MTFEEEIRDIITKYVDRVGVRKATDESLYILSKIGYTPPSFLEVRGGRVFAVAKFRIMVLEYLYGDDDDGEGRLLKAAKDYLHVSKRDYFKSKTQRV